MKRTLGLIAGLWGIAAFAAVQTFEWTFDEGDVSLPVDGKGPVMLADGTLPHENIGAPWVMVKDVSFTAGEGASVSFEGERVLIAEGVKVARETAAVEDGGEDADTEAQIETASARDIALLGEFTGWHKGRRGAFGTARLYPVAYEEDGGKVWLAKRIVLKVESADTKAQLRKAAKIAKAPKTAGGKVDYLIITGEAYKDAFQVLADFRATNDCVTARVVTTEEIEGEYDGTRPDGGSDTQTKIRNCIKDYVDNRATKYVLLGGDSSVVPHRGCYTLATTATSYKDLPCDLYYACLDGTWDANANGTYGENADAVNYGIDVAVGRVPADTLEKAQTYIRKAIAYECDRSVEGSETFLMIAAQMGNKYPSGYSSEYPAKGWRNYPASTEVFGDGLDEFGESGIDTTDCEIFTRRFWKQIIKDGTGVDGTKHRMLFHNRSTREIINGYKCYPGYANMEINEYNPHYVWCMSHGYNPDYTAKTQAGHQLDGQWGRNWADQITGRADIFFALSCYVGAFDLDCFSKHMLFNQNGGSVAYIGCSRQSFYDYLFNSATGGMVADFGRSFFGQIFNNSARRVGDAFADMKEDMVRNFGAGGNFPNDHRFMMHDMNLLGDPMLSTHTAKSRKDAPRLGATEFAGSEPASAKVKVELAALGSQKAVPLKVRYGTSPLLEGALATASVAADETGVREFALQGLASGTTYYYQAVADSADGTLAVSAVGEFTTGRYGVALGKAAAKIENNGTAAVASVPVVALDDDWAEVSLSVNGKTVAVWDRIETAGEVLATTFATMPGEEYTAVFTGRSSGGEESGATVLFTATTLEGWFDVNLAASGYREGADWTDLSDVDNAGGAWTKNGEAVLADAKIALSGAEIVFTPDMPSEAGSDVTIEGVVDVQSANAPRELPEGSVAAITFGLTERGEIRPYAARDGKWLPMDMPVREIEQNDEMAWTVEIDLRSSEAPRLRYTLGGEALTYGGEEWLALENAPQTISAIGYAGDGAVGSFKGTYESAHPIGMFEVPQFGGADGEGGGGGVSFGTDGEGNATFSVTVANAEAAAWYTPFTAERLGDVFVAETASVSGAEAESGTFTLTIDAGADQKFMKVVVSQYPYEAGTPLAE